MERSTTKLSFVSPGQLVKLAIDKPAVPPSGVLLFFHPDFIWNTPLAKKIKQYDFFGYAVNEALFMSEKEEKIIGEILANIQREYQSNIDKFSQSIIIGQIEVLLNYCDRFYERQFLTRKITNHHLLAKLEEVLEKYINSDNLLNKGLPTVQYIAGELNISPNYLGSLLKTLTQQTTKQIIQEKLIQKAKEKLSVTQLSIGEIAYELGFEHPQSFNKFFKKQTGQSPAAFRSSFN